MSAIEIPLAEALRRRGKPGGSNSTTAGRALPLKTVVANDVQVKSSDYLVKGLIVAGDLSVFYGPSGGGKTFAVLDLAHAIATGREILGRKVRQAPVLICALEGMAGFELRVAGIAKHHKGAPDLHIFAGGLQLHDNPANVDRLIATIHAVGARLVVIDTLSRAMSGADENGSSDMTSMISVFEKIAKETGAHVLIVHHTGKDESKGGRGHSSLRAAVGVEVEITRNSSGDGYTLKEMKVKDGPCGLEYAFKLQHIDLGKDDDGDAITTCVVEGLGRSSSPAKSVTKLPAGAKQALLWLREAIEEHGQPSPFELSRDIRVVKKDVWMDIARKRSDMAPEAIRKAIDRAITSLSVANVVGGHAPYFWVLK